MKKKNSKRNTKSSTPRRYSKVNTKRSKISTNKRVFDSKKENTTYKTKKKNVNTKKKSNHVNKKNSIKTTKKVNYYKELVKSIEATCPDCTLENGNKIYSKMMTNLLKGLSRGNIIKLLKRCTHENIIVLIYIDKTTKEIVIKKVYMDQSLNTWRRVKLLSGKDTKVVSNSSSYIVFNEENSNYILGLIQLLYNEFFKKGYNYISSINNIFNPDTVNVIK